ncbi:hypothetical protein CEW87_13985 [Parazoarcus communis]|uniref:DUF3375 domain-containing protein n=1 Tax=Parazoarcus communis TaxID=41977 RepID=A0A2U8H3I9_9RHOO|nr:hypothetical protein [Parazoarcus communis]AWI80371.1 hypothetical protein CEW87_13985 [Parazoarcus communis]
MASPRTLTYSLYTHWDVVESLVPLTRDFPAFDSQQLLSVIARANPALDSAQRDEVLRQMVSSDLLRLLPRGNALELHPLVLEFVRGLTREHDLGLSEVLRARVDAIKDATARLADGVSSNQSDSMRGGAQKLSELFRQISQQLDQDRHAILELAERAKSADANLPLSRRYAEVLEAYDSYVEPMAEMMDSGPSGTFYRHLENAEQALDVAVDTLEVRGALYTHRLAMRQVAFQAKELRRLGREVLKQCSDTLLPLREELRQHNALSAAISHLLGQVRKRGLRRTLRSATLPLWQRDMQRRVTVGNEVLTLMSEALNYVPDTVAFPEEDGGSKEPLFDLVDEGSLLAALRRDAPIDNLLEWLHRQYPQWNDATTLRLYHEIVQQPQWRADQPESPVSQTLNTVRVRLHPHRILASNDPA